MSTKTTSSAAMKKTPKTGYQSVKKARTSRVWHREGAIPARYLASARPFCAPAVPITRRRGCGMAADGWGRSHGRTRTAVRVAARKEPHGRGEHPGGEAGRGDRAGACLPGRDREDRGDG